jgi:hypothetical protein
MDVALIPLYVYITLAVHANSQLAVPQYKTDGTQISGNWRFTSFFNNVETEFLLLFTWYLAAAMAGTHLIATGFDLYLVVIFRKIAKLPPDMNPLEDNLTSRQGKHKYKNSEATLAEFNPHLSEAEKKRLAHLSGSTLGGSRTSMAKESFIEDRQVPFNHSRTGSKTNLAFSPHNPESARWSKHMYDGQQELYREAIASPTRSRYQVRPDGKLEVRARRGSRSPSKRTDSAVVMGQTGDIADSRHSYAASATTPPKRDSSGRIEEFERPKSASHSPDRFDSPRPASYHHRRRSSQGIASPSAANLTPENVKVEQKQQLLHDNWYVLEDDVDEDEAPPPPPPAKSSARNSYIIGKNGYTPIQSQHDHGRHDSYLEPTTGQQQEYQDTFVLPRQQAQVQPMPLAMHPPTPPIPTGPEDHAGNRNDSGVNRSLTAASAATNSSSVYSESSPSLKSHHVNNPNGTPKGKYYGDLASATRGIREQNTSPAPHFSFTNDRQGGLGDLGGFGNLYGYGLPPSPQPPRTPSPEKSSRVISRSGADIADESVLFLPQDQGRGSGKGGSYGMRSRREVSGKVAEEGRGSWGRRG